MIEPTEWPESIGDLRSGLGRLNVYRTMAQHPALLRAWAPLRSHIVLENALGRECAEIAILRVAARLGVDYEWGHHVVRARDIGIAETHVQAVRDGPDGLPSNYRLIVEAVDELLECNRLTPTMRDRFGECFGAQAVLDLAVTVAFYFALACLVQTFDTPLDRDIAERLAGGDNGQSVT